MSSSRPHPFRYRPCSRRRALPWPGCSPRGSSPLYPLPSQAVQPEKGAAMAWVLSTGLIASVDSAFTDWFGHKWVTPGLATNV